MPPGCVAARDRKRPVGEMKNFSYELGKRPPGETPPPSVDLERLLKCETISDDSDDHLLDRLHDRFHDIVGIGAWDDKLTEQLEATIAEGVAAVEARLGLEPTAERKTRSRARARGALPVSWVPLVGGL